MFTNNVVFDILKNLNPFTVSLLVAQDYGILKLGF